RGPRGREPWRGARAAARHRVHQAAARAAPRVVRAGPPAPAVPDGAVPADPGGAAARRRRQAAPPAAAGPGPGTLAARGLAREEEAEGGRARPRAARLGDVPRAGVPHAPGLRGRPLRPRRDGPDIRRDRRAAGLARGGPGAPPPPARLSRALRLRAVRRRFRPGAPEARGDLGGGGDRGRAREGAVTRRLAAAAVALAALLCGARPVA